jgi:hypothetical protein
LQHLGGGDNSQVRAVHLDSAILLGQERIDAFFAPSGYPPGTLPCHWAIAVSYALERHKTSLAMQSESEILFTSNRLGHLESRGFQDPSAMPSSPTPKLNADMGP